MSVLTRTFPEQGFFAGLASPDSGAPLPEALLRLDGSCGHAAFFFSGTLQEERQLDVVDFQSLCQRNKMAGWIQFTATHTKLS